MSPQSRIYLEPHKVALLGTRVSQASVGKDSRGDQPGFRTGPDPVAGVPIGRRRWGGRGGRVTTRAETGGRGHRPGPPGAPDAGRGALCSTPTSDSQPPDGGRLHVPRFKPPAVGRRPGPAQGPPRASLLIRAAPSWASRSPKPLRPRATLPRPSPITQKPAKTRENI